MANKIKSLYLFISVCFFLISCNTTLDSLSEYVNNEDNGLIQTVENESFKIESKYMPHEYLVSLENNGAPKEILVEKLNKKKDLLYFNIKLISKTDKPLLKAMVTNKQEEDLRLQYYIGAFEYDIYLSDGNDTLPCALYHFERTYGILPFNNVSVAFENNQKEENDKTLIILDRALGFGIQTFKFNKEDITNIPKLKF